MDESHRSLTNIVNYPKFQFPNLLVLYMGIGSTILVLGGLIVLQARMMFSLAETRAEVEAVRSVLWTYGSICAGAIVLATLLLSLWSLILTHRVVGPFPRLKKEVETMHENKQVHLLHVREYDYLQDFFEKVNNLLIRLMKSSDRYELANNSIDDPGPEFESGSD